MKFDTSTSSFVLIRMAWYILSYIVLSGKQIALEELKLFWENKMTLK